MSRHYPNGTGSVAAIFGHPLHPMIVPFPIAFLVGAFLSDLAFATWRDPFFAEASRWLIGAGLAAGALAALLGLVDLLGVGRARTSVIGWSHGIGNAVALAISFLNLLVRREDPGGAVLDEGLVLSGIVAALLVVTGWLGGELVYRRGIGVASNVGGPPPGEQVPPPGETSGRPADRR